GWDSLHASYDMRRVNHSTEYMADDGANTNQAESFFSRLRRAEYGVHHRISGRHLHLYASEMAFREDARRVPNGMQWHRTGGAHRALRSDLTRAALDALRDAPGPMTTKELARHVMAERGLNSADIALLQLFTRRTGALLRWQKKRGILRSVKDPQHGKFDLWE